MNANLNFPSMITLSPNGGSVVPNPTPTDGDLKSEEFSAVLTGQMFKAERQSLATQVLGGPGLQIVSLGAKLDLITTDAPLPDLPSLANFARAQGLDEVAIQALFGPNVGPNASSKNGFAISGLGQPYANKPVPGIALAVPLPQVGKANFLAIDASSIGLGSATLGRGSGLEAPRPESRPKIADIDLLTEVLSDLGAAPAKTMGLLDSPQVAVDSPQVAVDSPQVAVDLPKVAVDLPKVAVDLPQVAVDLRQVAVDLRQVAVDSAQVLRPPTPVTVALGDSKPQLASTLQTAPVAKANHESQPELIATDSAPGVAVTLPASVQKTGRLQVPEGLTTQVVGRPQLVNMPLAASSGAVVPDTDQANTEKEPVGIAVAGWVSLGQGSTSKVAEARPDMRLDVNAEESIQDAIRLSITMPTKDITKRAANTAGTAETLNWSRMLAGPSANKAAASTAWEALHLTIPEGFDLDEQSGTLSSSDQDQVTAPGTQQQAEGPAAKSGTSTAQLMRGEASAAAAQTELRAVQQQQLADRLGEAAAHRLIAQIERGEWKMQMRLQPGKLGKIDVELTMHARGLEAMFSADSALTRELIAQGSARLKETLTQAGMTVASVTVNGDQTSQSGGNSTPQRGNQSTADARPVKARAEVSAAVPETTSTRTDNGLNILA
jgi:flagellar hook-length control protein FliK